jgi:MOSC domain-containing protein YiiM
MSKIYSLCCKKTPSEQVEPYRYSREPVEQVHLIAGHGIEGDLKAGLHPDRHLNIMSFETLQSLRAEGFNINPGEMGEQVIVSELLIDTLTPGTRLQFGNEAVIEITKPRTGCDWFEKVQGKSPKLAANRMGMMATVIKGGQVKIGDSVQLLETIAE